MAPRRFALLLGVTAACGGPSEGVPEGKLAAVGDVAFGPEDVAAVQAQLGAYAQLRFAGGEGRPALLRALVDAEVLAQRAVAFGLGDDPRVRWAELEEIAAVHRSAELERRVPRAEIAAGEAALRAWYDAHQAELVVPERRSVEGVIVDTWAAAEELEAKLKLGAELETLGTMAHTALAERDDAEYPGYHVVLFDPALQVGDMLPRPVVIGEKVIVARVREIQAAAPASFDDDAVRERAVEAVRAPLVAKAESELVRELAQRFPEG